MAGRGEISDESNSVHPRVFALSKEGDWVPAVHPIHWDKKSAGVGLGKAFAVALAQEDEDVIIGLVPAACGGSSIRAWVPGGFHDQTKSHPYDDAISRTRRAMKDGVLKAILWHQGESDSNAKQASSYEENLKALVERFRNDLGDDKLPFIIGQLGQFPSKPWNEYRELVNQAHRSVATHMHRVGFVSSDGLTSLSDNTHFDSSSLRTFGNRYAGVYLELREGTATPSRLLLAPN